MKRPWGVALGAGDVPLRERLQRFFHVHGDLARAQVRDPSLGGEGSSQAG